MHDILRNDLIFITYKGWIKKQSYYDLQSLRLIKMLPVPGFKKMLMSDNNCFRYKYYKKILKFLKKGMNFDYCYSTDSVISFHNSKENCGPSLIKV